VAPGSRICDRVSALSDCYAMVLQSRDLADPATSARRDQGSAAHSRLDNLNESATQFDPCYRDGRMLDRSTRHRSF